MKTLRFFFMAFFLLLVLSCKEDKNIPIYQSVTPTAYISITADLAQEFCYESGDTSCKITQFNGLGTSNLFSPIVLTLSHNENSIDEESYKILNGTFYIQSPTVSENFLIGTYYGDGIRTNTRDSIFAIIDVSVGTGVFKSSTTRLEMTINRPVSGQSNSDTKYNIKINGNLTSPN